ncbi:MAG: hypothetical protein RIQ79_333 [Verrucomicrobiota bacterium]
MLGGVFGGNENEHAQPGVFRDEMKKELGAARRIYLDGALQNLGFGGGLGRHVQPHGIAQQGGGEGLDLRREGGGEKQALAAGGQEGDDAAELVAEAEIEQAVGLVEHEGRDGGEREGVVVEQIEQAAGRGDENIGAATEGHHLRVDGDAAVNDEGLERGGQVAGVFADRLADLGGELASGGEDEGAHEASAGTLLGA